jgi:hypothetical protein
MPTPDNEQLDLDRVADYLATHGLSAERFSKEELTPGKKNPDFRVRKHGALVAYCEVKSPEDDNWQGLRKDPTVDRLTRFLMKAAVQFNTFNPSRTELNILAYVSHKPTTLYADLHEMLTGRFLATSGEEIQTMRPPAQAKDIDLYLWFDGAVATPDLLVNDLDPERVNRVCALFDAASGGPS